MKALAAVTLFMFLAEVAKSWGSEDFRRSRRRDGKLGSLVKRTALTENNFVTANIVLFLSFVFRAESWGILICELCSCSTSSLGCVFMQDYAAYTSVSLPAEWKEKS